jgi:hypothetical protein
VNPFTAANLRGGKMAKKIAHTKSKTKHIAKIRRRICTKCNRTLDGEDLQCPFCGVKVVTYSLNTEDEWRRLPQRFPRKPEKSSSLPLKADGVPMPGEYKTPRAKILRGGRIESKRQKH